MPSKKDASLESYTFHYTFEKDLNARSVLLSFIEENG